MPWSKVKVNILDFLQDQYPEPVYIAGVSKSLKLSEDQLEKPLTELDNDLLIAPLNGDSDKIEITTQGMGFLSGINHKKEDEKPAFIEDPDKGECVGLIKDKYHFICPDDTQQDLSYFVNGIYKPAAPLINREVTNYYGDKKASKHLSNEVYFTVGVHNYIKREEIDSDINIINLQNGRLDIVDLADPKIKPHSHTIYNLNQLPITYTKDAKCENFLKFLSEVLHEKDIPIMQELFGFVLYKDHRVIHKAFMFLGEGANGKSTLANILIEFIGPENVSNVSLQRLNYDRWGPGHLYGKMANIDTDIGPNKIKDAGNFLRATSGDCLFCERKGKDGFPFKPYAKNIFCANVLPEFENKTNALFRRWILFNFPNIFEGTAAKQNLAEELTTTEELSGILNWALEGLKRILENGCFSDGLTTDQIREDYIRKSDPPAAFFLDCIVEDVNGEIIKRELYRAYLKYCNELKLPTITEATFAKDHVKRSFIDIDEGRRGAKGSSKPAWLGIRYAKPDETDNFYEFGNRGKNATLVTGKKPTPETDNTPSGNRGNRVNRYTPKFERGLVPEEEETEENEEEIEDDNSGEVTKTPVTPVTGTDQKDRLEFLLRQFKIEEKKSNDNTADSQELLTSYSKCGWDEKTFKQDIKTLKKDGIIYEPKDGRFKIV